MMKIFNKVGSLWFLFNSNYSLLLIISTQRRMIDMLLPEITSWKQWGEIFTDTKLWTPVVKEICKNHNIIFDDIRAGFPGTNAVFILDNIYVVKIYAPRCHEDYTHELEIHSALQKNTDIPVPKIFFNGVFKDRVLWPYIIMEYKNGYPIREVRHKISRENLIEIYSNLGKIVRRIHTTSYRCLPNTKTYLSNWEKFINNRKKECIIEYAEKEILTNDVINEINSYIKKNDVLSLKEDMVLLNGDLTEDHLLLEELSGKWKISALIDLADSRIGVKEYDWIPLWFGLLDMDMEGLRVFMSSYDKDIVIDEYFRSKVMTYTFLHQFGTLIIKEILEKIGNPSIDSIKVLKELLWNNPARGEKLET